MDDARLKGRRVLITGAGSGIGRALAERALGAGAEATLVDLRADSLADMEAAAECHAMDVADADAWARLPRAGGGFDFVALNAGVMSAPPEAPPAASDFLKMDIGGYRRVMRVNVDGVVHGVRRLVPELREGGAIVATSSGTGLVGYAPDVAYSMSKHAVVALVRGVAPLLDRAKKRQRICAICPGGVRTGIVPAAFRDTPMMEPSVIADEIAALWLDGHNGDVMAKMRPELPALRIDEPELPAWW